MIHIVDQLRDATTVRAADPRMAHQSLEERITYISQFTLSEEVPEKVRIHFDTGRNLFVYAWHVYRFHMVAEQHVLATLEMATRLRLEAVPGFSPPRGLSNLLQAARKTGLIANERFSARDQWAMERARRRHDYAVMSRMQKDGLEECIVDHSEVMPNEEDRSYDWLGNFIDGLPQLRNMHAHGSSILYPSVGRTFEIVVELVNQLFLNCSAKADRNGKA
jgi:hypothetical protein